MKRTIALCEACGCDMKNPACTLTTTSGPAWDFCRDCRDELMIRSLKARGDKPLQLHCSECKGTGKVQVRDEATDEAACCTKPCNTCLL